VGRVAPALASELEAVSERWAQAATDATNGTEPATAAK
jgi:hypothetical protein